MKRAVVLAMVLSVTGCPTGFETTLGPRFQPAVAATGGVVYLYRPEHIVAGRAIVHVVIDGEERLLLTNGYVAMRAAPGRHEIHAYTTPEWQNYVGYGYGPTQWRGALDVEVRDKSATFVEVTASLGPVALVEQSSDVAMPQIQRCGLSPGGALR